MDYLTTGLVLSLHSRTRGCVSDQIIDSSYFSICFMNELSLGPESTSQESRAGELVSTQNTVRNADDIY